MRKLLICLLCLLVAGCASGGDDAPLPTVIQMPGATNTADVVPAENTANAGDILTSTESGAEPDEPTSTVRPSATASLTPTPEAVQNTASPSPSPQGQPSATLIPPTATAIVVEPVRISTVTPIPVGADVIPPPIPVLAADVIINEAEFQAKMQDRLSAIPEIQSAQVDFIAAEGVNIRMTATGGDVIVTGDVTVGFQLSGGLAAISIVGLSVGSGEVPQSFVEVAQEQLFTLVVETFDALLTEKLGPEHDLEQLTITDDTMQLMLLIPE